MPAKFLRLGAIALLAFSILERSAQANQAVYDETGHLIGHTADAPSYWGAAPDGTPIYLRNGSLEGFGPGTWIGHLDPYNNGSLTALVRNLTVNQTYAYTWQIENGRYSIDYTLTVTAADGTVVSR